jgi:hypothetical protein
VNYFLTSIFLPKNMPAPSQFFKATPRMTNKFTESTVEEAVLEWAIELEYAILNGPDIAPGESAAERTGFDEVVLVGRLRDAIASLPENRSRSYVDAHPENYQFPRRSQDGKKMEVRR